MVDWLNTNAGAVQGLAAVATLVVTIVLAGLTRRYVRLTSDIARANLVQAGLLLSSRREQATLAREALRVHALRLHETVSGLHGDKPSSRLLREWFLLTSADVDQLEALARPLGPQVLETAGVVAMHLRWLVGLAARVQAVNPSLGYSFSSQELSGYESSKQVILEGLLALIKNEPGEQPISRLASPGGAA
jgi:hypothetical protein